MKFSLVRKLFSAIFFSRSGSASRSGLGTRFSFKIKHEKVMLYILKIATKFDVVPKSLYPNPDQDQDFTLNFNTRITFYT